MGRHSKSDYRRQELRQQWKIGLNQMTITVEVFFLCAYYSGSHRTCSAKKGVLNKFTLFTRKHMCWRLQHTCFPVNIPKFLKTIFEFFEEHLRTATSVTKALIVLPLTFVLIQTYKTFSLFNFHNFTCKLGNKN